MTCADIELAVMDVLYYYDTDASGYITPADNVDMEHYDLMIAGCDSDNDGNIDPCEIHACIL
jgi:Ca2+-binding EF-hand superfamily protein